MAPEPDPDRQPQDRPLEDSKTIPVGGPGLPPREAELAPPERIGPYKVLGRLGSGGMGDVHLQDYPVRRKVALKLVKPGMDTRSVLARFDSERQALALMDHPHIAKVLDAGALPGGRPYFVMELVQGLSLTRYCDRHKLDTRERLAIFLQVCAGVQHAHQKGILHRDLKPGNILVTSADDRPHVKIIDFGLAKAMGPSLTELTLHTQVGQMLGTPEYMSPEQIRGGSLDVDTRSDVYTLGVVFYELLVGALPFSAGVDEKVTLAEMQRRIIEDEVPRPSTRASAESHRSEEMAALRRTEPHRLARSLTGDLDWIALKAMEKSRELRYATVTDLARDIEAHLQDLPVSAGPPALTYRARKFLRRHRGPVLAAGAVLLSILVGLALSLFLLVETFAAKKAAEERETEARIAREAEASARRDAEESARILEQKRDELLRHADMRQLEGLLLETDALWPAVPSRLPALRSWIERALSLSARRPLHESDLVRLRSLSQPLTGDELARLEILEDLVARLDRLGGVDPPTGLLGDIKERIGLVDRVERSEVDSAASWEEALASIADPVECPLYRGLRMNPQVALVPLGRDPASGLWEFAHLLSGEPARLDETGKPILGEATGLVLVLIPGGTFELGGMPPGRRLRDGSPNCDPWAEPYEAPLRQVSLDPFFLAKHEMTQAQWQRIADENPSLFGPDRDIGSCRHSLLHPVESLSFEEARRMLVRLDLELPTEAQWEVAARGNTTTPWWTGEDPESLRGAANLADLSYVRFYGPSDAAHDGWNDDGFGATAPVGSFRPNAFGLHDTLGNVWEWCRDGFGDYSEKAAPGDGYRPGDPRYPVYRGGCFDNPAIKARSAARACQVPDPGNGYMGVRPARRVR